MRIQRGMIGLVLGSALALAACEQGATTFSALEASPDGGKYCRDADGGIVPAPADDDADTARDDGPTETTGPDSDTGVATDPSLCDSGDAGVP